MSEFFFNWTTTPHASLECSFACLQYLLWCCHVPYTAITCKVTKRDANEKKRKAIKIDTQQNFSFSSISCYYATEFKMVVAVSYVLVQ